MNTTTLPPRRGRRPVTGEGDMAPEEQQADLVETIRASIIGDDCVVDGPFGPRRILYADYTASGRALTFIEDYLREQVMPLYANTHSESSLTGMQTTRYREQAREAIRSSVGAGDGDAVIFCGSGATGAINHLIAVLNLRLPYDLDTRYGLSATIPEDQRPVVLVGPYEHHSNEIPWRETIAEVVEIGEDADGHIDADDLERQLVRFADRPLVIGSFSAASNVTGIKSDTRALSMQLHAHGALSFWDFAAAGPYLPIDMNGSAVDGATDPLDYKDAIFLSPHKFVGGPGTPGVLVVKRTLLQNTVPAVPGGGTVSYVNADEHHYIEDREHREEGGTPAILESIRAGLVFRLKEAVGTARILAEESRLLARVLGAWQAQPNIEIMGSTLPPRLAIVSFNIRHGDRFLHHEFVVALLNDLFGIQARGGCSCAGPYGHRLLGIDMARSRDFEAAVATGCNIIKPGWARIGFNYFFSDTVADYIIDAVGLVAEHGWRLLPHYTFDSAAGSWRHRQAAETTVGSLDDLRLAAGAIGMPAPLPTAGEEVLATQLAAAREILLAAEPPDSGGTPDAPLPELAEALRWFSLTADALPGDR